MAANEECGRSASEDARVTTESRRCRTSGV
jgi:hypothetical protein